MKQALLVFVLIVSLFSLRQPIFGQNADHSQDEQAIRANADEYRGAYNRGDAKSLAALWVDDGESIDQSGFLLRGRDVIAQAFAEFFSQNPGVKLEINVDTILFPRNDLATETGTTRAMAADGGPPVEGRYSVTHGKRDGKWMILSVHEQAPLQNSNFDKLKDLGWLIGSWVDDEQGQQPKIAPVLRVDCYWSPNRNFIIRDFSAISGGTSRIVGTQRIGWHGPSKQIQSWAFDANGGIITGTWSQVGDQWKIASNEALSDGQSVTATESVTHNADGSQSWLVNGRVSSGKALPDEAFRLSRIR